MARYIDVDALIAEYDRVHIGAPGGARKLMVDAPTADVVPRAVVEETSNEIVRLCLEIKADLLKAFEEVRVNTAREIFKDLWEMVIPEKCTDGCAYYLDMAELAALERKYTGDSK